MAARELVRVDHVTQTYAAGSRPFTAIHDVSLSLAEGEFVCLLGPSGCGKSTLLRMITGLQRPTEGRVFAFPEVGGLHHRYERRAA